MKLCPLKYGIKIVVPPFPSGDVWLTYDQVAGDFYLGDYTGATWTPVSTGLASGIIMGAMVLRNADNIYFKVLQTIYYADVGNLTSWSTITTTDTSPRPEIYSDGTYIHAPYQAASATRMTLPSGSLGDVTVSGDSRADSFTEMGGVLYGISPNSTSLVTSSDGGLNWGFTGSHGTSISGNTGVIDNDGSMLVFTYLSGTDGLVHSKSSTDSGATWSGDQLTLGTAFAANPLRPDGMRFHEGKWFIVLDDGKCAYSANGTSWTAGATVPRNVLNVTYGIGCIVVGCEYREHYITTDHGASWSLFDSPVTTGTASDLLYTFWIGDAP